MPIQNVFIVSDLEGAHSVTRFVQTRKPGTALENARCLHTEQVNAMLAGIRDYNCDIRIHVWDSHGLGGIHRSDLGPVHAFLPPGRIDLVDYFRRFCIDAICFESAHAKNHTPRANLCHTMSSRKIDRYIINGSDIGEIGLRAAIAGAAGIPTVYLNGDDKACSEARALMPWITTTTTKTGTGLQTADNLPRRVVLNAIKNDSCKAFQQIQNMHPYIVTPPIDFEIKQRLFYALKRLTGQVFNRKQNPLIFKNTTIFSLVEKKIL